MNGLYNIITITILIITILFRYHKEQFFLRTRASEIMATWEEGYRYKDKKNRLRGENDKFCFTDGAVDYRGIAFHLLASKLLQQNFRRPNLTGGKPLLNSYI